MSQAKALCSIFIVPLFFTSCIYSLGIATFFLKLKKRHHFLNHLLYYFALILLFIFRESDVPRYVASVIVPEQNDVIVCVKKRQLHV